MQTGWQTVQILMILLICLILRMFTVVRSTYFGKTVILNIKVSLCRICMVLLTCPLPNLSVICFSVVRLVQLCRITTLLEALKQQYPNSAAD